QVRPIEADRLQIRDHIPRVPLDEGPHEGHSLLLEVLQEPLPEGLANSVALERGVYSNGLQPAHVTVLPELPRAKISDDESRKLPVDLGGEARLRVSPIQLLPHVLPEGAGPGGLRDRLL